MLGGREPSDKIFRAPVSNPLSWTDTGLKIPNALYESQVTIIGNYAYLFWGYGDLDGIYRVPITSNVNANENWILRPNAPTGPWWSTSSTTNSNLVFNSGGNLGIGTTTPWRTLSVTGTVGFDGLTGATGAGSLCLDSNKQVVYNSGSDACLSSTRATKHDIKKLDLSGLDLISKLEPSSFIYNQGDGRIRYGFMAEDTALIDDRLATHNESGEITGIDDRAILSVTVKAIKEMDLKIKDLEASAIASGGTGTDGLFDWVVGKFKNVFGIGFGQGELCLEDVCVNKAQLKELLEKNNISQVSSSSSSSSTSSVASSSSSSVAESSSSSSSSESSSSESSSSVSSESSSSLSEAVSSSSESSSSSETVSSSSSGEAVSSLSSSEASSSSETSSSAESASSSSAESSQ